MASASLRHKMHLLGIDIPLCIIIDQNPPMINQPQKEGYSQRSIGLPDESTQKPISSRASTSLKERTN